MEAKSSGRPQKPHNMDGKPKRRPHYDETVIVQVAYIWYNMHELSVQEWAEGRKIKQRVSEMRGLGGEYGARVLLIPLCSSSSPALAAIRESEPGCIGPGSMLRRLIYVEESGSA
jgi:hypothetical protein